MRACASLPCETGACCVSGFGLAFCLENFPKDKCPTSAQFTLNTACSAVHCGGVKVGACCGCSVPTGVSYHCQTVNTQQCAALGGKFLGEGTFCELIPSSQTLPGGSTCNFIECNNEGHSGTEVGGCCFNAGFCGSLPKCHCTGPCNPFGQVPLGKFLGAGKICQNFGNLCPDKGQCCNALTGQCSDFATASTCQAPNVFTLYKKCGETSNPGCMGKCVTGCGSITVCVDNVPKSACFGGTWTFGVCP